MVSKALEEYVKEFKIPEGEKSSSKDKKKKKKKGKVIFADQYLKTEPTKKSRNFKKNLQRSAFPIPHHKSY